MSKLWDTCLPYEEYYQLNKLMTALFGENYHKIENPTVNNGHGGQQSSKPNRLDAEHVVNLVRAYLDQNKIDDAPPLYPTVAAPKTAAPATISTQPLSTPPKNSSPSMDSYSSVSNLIMTLKRRKKQSDGGSANLISLFQNKTNSDEFKDQEKKVCF